MVWFIEELIAFLTELKSASLFAQILTFVSIYSLFAGVFVALPVWLMTRKVRPSVTAYNKVKAQRDTAREQAAQIQAECDRLQAQTPEAFLAQHAKELRDQNNERAMALSEIYIENQKEALLTAFKTRMDEAVGHAVEDGAPSFALARSWARAAQALSPDDAMLGALVDELAEAEAVAASGARVKLPDAEKRAKRLEHQGRLPRDLEALVDAWLNARDRGNYALMLLLADHGLRLTRRRPFGEGSHQHLLFRRHHAEALNWYGRESDALAEADALRAPFVSAFGDRHESTLSLRYLIAQCRADTGDASGALKDAEELLPLHTEVLDARHPNVRATRYLIAQCRAGTGDASGALKEAEELLPLLTEVRGARHPNVLATRHLIAQCRADTGDASGALKEAEELLPLRTEVLGARHPHAS